jgi:hypothetical protein
MVLKVFVSSNVKKYNEKVIYKMKPSKEYLDMISKRLENMNPHVVNSVSGAEPYAAYKLPSFEEQLGQAALDYLNSKKPGISPEPDPLFSDRNTY